MRAARGPAPSRASALPIVIAAGALVASVVIALVVALSPASAPVSILGVPMPLVTSTFWWLSLIGYLLTPIAVIACYGWDAIGQRDGLRRDRNFVLHREWTTALLWLAGASIIVGAWHVLNLSVPLSEAWGLS